MACPRRWSSPAARRTPTSPPSGPAALPQAPWLLRARPRASSTRAPPPRQLYPADAADGPGASPARLCCTASSCACWAAGSADHQPFCSHPRVKPAPPPPPWSHPASPLTLVELLSPAPCTGTQQPAAGSTDALASLQPAPLDMLLLHRLLLHNNASPELGPQRRFQRLHACMTQPAAAPGTRCSSLPPLALGPSPSPSTPPSFW